uniref:Uncharacterized protein n=1 Tax=Canis lupus dingo TaxID=286419 RepID=A0A8C0QZT9_CANLU
MVSWFQCSSESPSILVLCVAFPAILRGPARFLREGGGGQERGTRWPSGGRRMAPDSLRRSVVGERLALCAKELLGGEAWRGALSCRGSG